MKFTQEHEELRRTVRNFVDKEINPFIEEWEEAGAFPMHQLFKKMGELGLLGIDKPEAFGGLGLDYSFVLVANEELGNINCGGVGLAINVQTCMATPALARFGSDELRNEFLAPAIQGDMVASIAVSEESAGSDVAAIKTSAIRDGDDYIINGSKMWITNATQADWLCALVNTQGENPHQNKSLIVVPSNLHGVTIGEKLNKLGMRSSDTAPVYFDDVRVPARYLIGEEGKGFYYQMLQFQEERLSAISNLKALENSILYTIDYCKQRNAFGKAIIDNQSVHFRLAELQTEVEALRSLFYRAAESLQQGDDVTLLASMAKLKIGRLSRELTDCCLQYWGGMGFMWDNPVSRFFRDNRLISIGGGADEIMLGIICKHMGILPEKMHKKPII